MNLGFPLSPLVLALLVIAAVLPFARLLARKQDFVPRFVCGAAGFAGGVVALESARAWLSATLSGLAAIGLEALMLAGVLVLAVAFVMLCYDSDIWTALFCATAGYAIQGIAMSFAVLLRNLAYGFYRAVPLPVSLGLILVSAAIVYTTCQLSMSRTIEEHGTVAVSPRPMLLMTGMVIVVSIIFDLAGRELHLFAVPTLYVYVLRVIQIVAGAFLLFVEYEFIYRRQLETDVATIERIRADEARQYRLSKENIDAINMRFHDIRHQIRHLSDGSEPGEGYVDRELLADIAREVRIYDASVTTGNEALDVLLTEKRLACEHEDIAFSCIVDGEALSFMGPSDLYAFLGNVLDAAIEAVSAIEDRERRSISLNVSRRLGMVSVHVENYLAQNVEASQQPIPEYGAKAIRLVVEHYGGSLTMREQDGIFHLNALIPQP